MPRASEQGHRAPGSSRHLLDSRGAGPVVEAYHPGWEGWAGCALPQESPLGTRGFPRARLLPFLISSPHAAPRTPSLFREIQPGPQSGSGSWLLAALFTGDGHELDGINLESLEPNVFYTL